MADVENVITLGIGSAPGSIGFFVRFGLDAGAAAPVNVSLTAGARDVTLTAGARDVTLTAGARDLTLTAPARDE